MGLTPAPVEAFPLAWVALIPLWILMVRATFKEAMAYALAWGFAYHGLALFWITGIHPMTWLGVPWLGSIAIALFCWLFITFWGVALVAVWSAGIWGLT
ncbi:MAG: apolipoprotein N-acyltransferase, partial [Cyanobacteriota bacterium]|nr:apolipoprotein N-acyltransferase [Cyanobacteriota bacterium]